MIKRLKQRLEQWEDQLEETDRKLWEVLRFLTIFTITVVPVYLLTWSGWNPIWLRQFHATVASTFTSLIGIPAEQAGTRIMTDVLVVDVSTDSTGWKSFLALSGLIIAYRERGTAAKLAGIGAGVIAIFLVNQLRLITMIAGVAWYSMSYELVHTILWRWGMTASVIVLWLAWIYLSSPPNDS